MFSRIFKISLLVCGMMSCVNDDDYSIPKPIEGLGISISDSQIITFKALHSRYAQAEAGGRDVAILNEAQDIYIEGYVVSSDLAGNFFEELIIQNKIDDSDPDEDPRLGIRIAINVGSLSDTYDFGRKVYVKLNGLSLGESSGVLTLGKGEDPSLEQIQEFEYRNIVIRTTEVAEIEPKIVSIESFRESDVNTFVQIQDLQFNQFEVGATFASEAFDEFDGFRLLESCQSGASAFLQTSTFADFRSLIIPSGVGHVSGILSRNFRDDFYVLAMNSVSDIDFSSSERCDPMQLSCGLATSIGSTNLFYENFETQRNNQLIQGNGWTNFIEVGSEGWEAYSSTSTNASLGRSARFQSASSGDVSNIGWLITPAINLDVHNNVTLQFKTSNSLADSSYMQVLYSLDWDGVESNITSATWGELADAYVVKDSDSFVQWFNSGPVNLSCVSGTMHIAFKYVGGGLDNFDGVYELDEVRVDY